MSLIWPSAIVIFCDDVRQEQGNKHSLMGIYDSDLVVTASESPITVERLFAVAYLTWPRGKAPIDNLAVEIKMPGKRALPRVQMDDFASYAAALPARRFDRANVFVNLSGMEFVDGGQVAVVLHVGSRSRLIGNIDLKFRRL